MDYAADTKKLADDAKDISDDINDLTKAIEDRKTALLDGDDSGLAMAEDAKDEAE